MKKVFFLKAKLGRVQGFSLIEMLIALLVLSIGLLGVAALQSRSQQFNHTAQVRTQASFLANEIMDRIRVNAARARDNSAYALVSTDTDFNSPVVKNCETDSCTPAELVAHDLNMWGYLLAQKLPEGRGSIAYDAGTRTYSITVSWAATDLEGDGTGSPRKSMTWNMRLPAPDPV